jgi:hypothetical protein
MHPNHTHIPTLVLLVSWLGLAGTSGCSSDTVPVYDIDCEDDAIGWSLDFADLVQLPPADFAVECAGGWGHGVETRAASEVVDLPNGDCERIIPHPQGGLLLELPSCFSSLWRDRLGIELEPRSPLVWVDEQAEEVRWVRDDLDYDRLSVVSVDGGGTELWAWGYGDPPDYVEYLSRIDLSTGDLLERVVVDDMPTPFLAVAAWPQDGGLWLTTRSEHEDSTDYRLYRMSSFAEFGPVLRTIEVPDAPSEGTATTGIPTLDPTPGGGVLMGGYVFGAETPLESLAEDGSVRWVLAEPHTSRVVDGYGGFLLGNVAAGGEPHDHHQGLAIQRRKLDDASLLWTRVHHRYDFAHEPKSDQWLDDSAWSYAARAEGGYLIAGGHAYPASSCFRQPIIWAIDINGEVEWAHRAEVCGDFNIPSDRVEGRALVLGHSYGRGIGAFNPEIAAEWLQYFDL